MNRTIASSVALAALFASVPSCSAADPTARGAKEMPDEPAAAAAPSGSGRTAAAPGPLPLADRMRGLDKHVYKVDVEGLPTIGSPSAPLTVVLFSDYECPYCRKVEPQIAQLRADHASDVRIVLVPKPLPFHKQARPAALAALAAAEQGKLEPMHRALVALDGKLDEASLTGAAREVGLDLARFDADRRGAKAEQTLATADALAGRFSVLGTPTMFLNGRRITGAVPDVVRQLGEEQLGAARALVKAGTPPARVYEAVTAGGLESAPPDPTISIAPGRAMLDGKPVHGLLAELARCWSAPGATRATSVDLTIGPEGKVRRVATEPPEHAGCVTSATAAWTFQKADGETKMKFMLKP